MVVFGHLYSGDSTVDRFLYAFHLPFFFLVSGVFHRNKGQVQWLKYIKTLIIPAIFFLLLEAIYQVIFLFCQHSPEFWAEALTLVKFYTLRMIRSTDLGPYWFLFALFWCKVLCDLAINHNKTLGTILWLIGLILPVIIKVRIPLFFSQGVMALPFYLTGYYCSDKSKNMKGSFNYVIVFVLALMLSIFITHFNGKISMNGYMFGKLQPWISIPLFYLNGFAGSVMILAFTLIPFPEIPSVKVLSKALITILGVQGIFIGIYSSMIGKDQNLLISALASIIIMWLCYLFHIAFHKLYQWK